MASNFETWLQEKHGEQYVGTDDMMTDDWEKWLQDLSVDDWLRYGDRYALYAQKLQIEALEKRLSERFK